MRRHHRFFPVVLLLAALLLGAVLALPRQASRALLGRGADPDANDASLRRAAEKTIREVEERWRHTPRAEWPEHVKSLRELAQKRLQGRPLAGDR